MTTPHDWGAETVMDVPHSDSGEGLGGRGKGRGVNETRILMTLCPPSLHPLGSKFRPFITITPDSPLHVSGIPLAIQCLAPKGYLGGRFRILRGTSVAKEHRLDPRRNGAIFLYRNVSTSIGGSYSCLYQRLVAGFWVTFRASPSIPIRVVEPPAQPEITAAPSYPAYLVGGNVTLTCAIPNRYTPAHIQFLKDSALVTNSTGIQRRFTHSVLHLTSIDTGNYTCSYQTLEYGRLLSSAPSLPVKIALTRESEFLPRRTSDDFRICLTLKERDGVNITGYKHRKLLEKVSKSVQ
ncbi:uncharacterized protein LOC122544198 [Chiloscyllium plagiosum]|uniref:uncharacterized protein LOC122544198 n=1 Tax=Chiloscyllium plagiosum TaxID=36176 RepID=UPI001CB835D7|nr:uncharacterized protein LOC122544198 [Chiloscyllium plagiosum]